MSSLSTRNQIILKAAETYGLWSFNDDPVQSPPAVYRSPFTDFDSGSGTEKSSPIASHTPHYLPIEALIQSQDAGDSEEPPEADSSGQPSVRSESTGDTWRMPGAFDISMELAISQPPSPELTSHLHLSYPIDDSSGEKEDSGDSPAESMTPSSRIEDAAADASAIPLPDSPESSNDDSDQSPNPKRLSSERSADLEAATQTSLPLSPISDYSYAADGLNTGGAVRIPASPLGDESLGSLDGVASGDASHTSPLPSPRGNTNMLFTNTSGVNFLLIPRPLSVRRRSSARLPLSSSDDGRPVSSQRLTLHHFNFSTPLSSPRFKDSRAGGSVCAHSLRSARSSLSSERSWTTDSSDSQESCSSIDSDDGCPAPSSPALSLSPYRSPNGTLDDEVESDDFVGDNRVHDASDDTVSSRGGDTRERRQAAAETGLLPLSLPSISIDDEPLSHQLSLTDPGAIPSILSSLFTTSDSPLPPPISESNTTEQDKAFRKIDARETDHASISKPYVYQRTYLNYKPRTFSNVDFSRGSGPSDSRLVDSESGSESPSPSIESTKRGHASRISDQYVDTDKASNRQHTQSLKDARTRRYGMFHPHRDSTSSSPQVSQWQRGDWAENDAHFNARYERGKALRALTGGTH